MTVTGSLAPIELSGLDGSNPLGFLAALGVLVTAHAAGERATRLGWYRRSTWVPFLEGVSTSEPQALGEILAGALAGRQVSEAVQDVSASAQQAWEKANKTVNNALGAVKRRKLKGSERKAALESEVRPLEQERARLRQIWLKTLGDAAPRPELALGKQLNCTSDEFREHATAFLASGSGSERETIDLLAAFGSDGCLRIRSNAIESTPFCFITGSGHQYFLETVTKLMDQVSPERVRRTLFDPWDYSDARLSMRWDPREDRRYALMDRDPTASGNAPRTVWMANLLGYRALVLFPAAPSRRGLAVTGWTGGDEPALTWPIWGAPLPPDGVRSVLQLEDMIKPRPDGAALRSRGILAVYRARRIEVGTGANIKVNFSPARPV